MRRRAIFSLIASCALTACAHQTTPEAMPGTAWLLNATESEGAKLAFGVPYSDNVVLMMACEPRSGQVQVLTTAPDGAGSLTLRSGRRSSLYGSQVTPSQLGEGVIVEATARATDPVLANFARSGELSFSVGKRRTALPAADRAKSSRFVESCRT
jgi:hypothetical protein